MCEYRPCDIPSHLPGIEDWIVVNNWLHSNPLSRSTVDGDLKSPLVTSKIYCDAFRYMGSQHELSIVYDDTAGPLTRNDRKEQPL